MVLANFRRLTQSTRGGTFVEWIVIVGCVALAAIGAYTAFGQSIRQKAQAEAQHVADLTPLSDSPAVPMCTGGTCQGGSMCFVAGTLVATPDGFTVIEKIEAGDEVLTFREETAEFLVGRVSATFRTPNRDVLEVHLRGDESPLRVTPGHRFFTLGRGWMGAEDLDPGEPLVDSTGAAVVVDSVSPITNRETVYNFEVDDTHTYFVGARRVLVHNPLVYAGRDGNGNPVYQQITSGEAGYYSPGSTLPSEYEAEYYAGGQFLFRGDSRPPDQIFQQGFRPMGGNSAIEDHVLYQDPSQYVSTSKLPRIGSEFAQGPFDTGGWVYTLGPGVQGIDVNETMGPHQYHRQQEVAVPGGILPSQIAGANYISPTGVAGPFVPNPNYAGPPPPQDYFHRPPQNTAPNPGRPSGRFRPPWRRRDGSSSTGCTVQ